MSAKKLLWVALVLSPAFFSLTTHATYYPLARIHLGISGAPTPGNVFAIVCTLQTYTDTLISATATITLRGGLTCQSGDTVLQYNEPLSPGSPVIKIENVVAGLPGGYAIEGALVAPFDSANYETDWDALVVRVHPDSGGVLAHPSLASGISGGIFIEDIQPPDTSSLSYPYLYEPMDPVPPDSALLDLWGVDRPPPFFPPPPPPWDPNRLTVIGQIQYLDPSGEERPLVNASITIVDDDQYGGGGLSDILGYATTDNNGTFRFVTSAIDDDNPSTTVDIYYVVRLENRAVTMREEWVDLPWGANPNVVWWPYPTTVVNVPAGTLIKNYTVRDVSDTGPCNIFSVVTRAWTQFRADTGKTPLGCSAYISGISSFFFWLPPGIHIRYGERWVDDTIRHEWGHWVSCWLTATKLTQSPLEWCVNHAFSETTDESCAWQEGFPHFLAVAVDGDDADNAYKEWNLECMARELRSKSSSDAIQTEGNVACALFDLYDSIDDNSCNFSGTGYDEYDGSLSEIVNVLWPYKSNIWFPDMFSEFWQAWKVYGGSPHDAVRAIAINRIYVNTPPTWRIVPDFAGCIGKRLTIDLGDYVDDVESSDEQMTYTLPYGYPANPSLVAELNGSLLKLNVPLGSDSSTIKIVAYDGLVSTSSNEFKVVWGQDAPLTVTWPPDYPAESLRHIVPVSGIVDECVDSIVVQWGEGHAPSSWSAYGISMIAGSGPVDGTMAEWNTGVVPTGDYSIRVQVFQRVTGGETIADEIIRRVHVAHRRAAVEAGAVEALETIQSGIDWAEMGDTLVVYCGANGCQYAEDIVMKETVHVVSAYDTIAIRIIGSGDNPTVTMSGHQYPCRLRGFIIEHTDGETYLNTCGIYVNDARPMVVDCIVRDIEGFGSSGLRVYGTSKPTFENCVVSNISDWTSKAAVLHGNSESVFRNCSFLDNGGSAVLIDGEVEAKPVAEFVDCLFTGNRGGTGSAVQAFYDVDDPLDAACKQLRFFNCQFANNESHSGTSDFGGVVNLHYCDAAEFENCSFTDNDPGYFPPGSGVICGDFGAVIRNCTIALNRPNSHPSAHHAAIDRYYATRTGIPIEIDKSIIAFNGGPAVYPSSADVVASNSDFFGNQASGAAPSDYDWLSIGQEMLNENPAFCDTLAGSYDIYAFSPCAAGVSSPELIGAFGVGCIPPATVSVLTDSLDGPDHVLNACPKGDGIGCHVQIDVLDSVVTRAIAPGEFRLDFSSYSGVVFDDNGVVSASVAADSSNWFATTISHRWFGGFGNGAVDVLLNGVPIGTPAQLNVRTFDETADGMVNIIDFGRFGQSFPSPPEPYVYYRDYNADSAIDLIDFARFSRHYGHESPFGPIQLSPAAVVRQTDFHVRLTTRETEVGSNVRELRVDVALENVAPFTAMCVALKHDNPALGFKEWIPNGEYEGKVLVAPVLRDGVRQTMLGIMGRKNMLGSTLTLGTLVYTVNGTAQLSPDEFAILIGDVLLADGARGLLEGVSVQKSEPEPSGYHYGLSQNYPNPFNPQTTIEYSIVEKQHVRLAVYSVSGQLVKVLVDEPKPRNVYRLYWDGRDSAGVLVASGVYFYKLQAGDFSQTKKLVVLR